MPALRKFRIKSASNKPMERLMACKVFASSFTSRRSTSTPLIYQNGTIVFPADGMLPGVIHTIYVDHCEGIAPQLITITDLMMRAVKKSNSERMGGDKSKNTWKMLSGSRVQNGWVPCCTA